MRQIGVLADARMSATTQSEYEISQRGAASFAIPPSPSMVERAAAGAERPVLIDLVHHEPPAVRLIQSLSQE